MSESLLACIQNLEATRRTLETVRSELLPEIGRENRVWQELDVLLEAVSHRLWGLAQDILAENTISTTGGKSSSHSAETKSSNPETSGTMSDSEVEHLRPF